MANISKIKVGNTSYGITATPTAHASTATTYGAASASNYGHVKLSDNYTSSAGAAASGIGASSLAVYNAYNTLNSNLANIITHHTVGGNDYIDLPLDINKANGIIVWRQSTSSGGLIFYIDRGVSCIHIADKSSNSSNIIVSSSATGILRITNNFQYSVQFLII